MLRLLAATLFVVTIGTACDDGDTARDSKDATPSQTVRRPIPAPVTIAQKPQQASHSATRRWSVPGATVDFGRIGGMNYQIEVPDDWNGRLVMYAHGDQDVELQVYPPPNRQYLIERGYAWASSSYSENVAIVTGLATERNGGGVGPIRVGERPAGVHVHHGRQHGWLRRLPVSRTVRRPVRRLAAAVR